MENLKNIELEELSTREAKNMQGGLVGVIVGAAVAYTLFAWGVCYDMGKSYR